MDDKVIIGALVGIIIGMYFKERGDTPLRLRIFLFILLIPVVYLRISDLKEKKNKKKEEKPE